MHNFPDQPNYNPGKPTIKFHSQDKNFANDFFLHVDDVRTKGLTAHLCWLNTRLVASLFNHLGFQDASRKSHGLSLEPSAWAGRTSLQQWYYGIY
jgi:hypothetical protein